MTAEAVAKTAYEGLMQGKRVIIPGFSNKLLAFVARLAPHSISNPIVEYVNH
jgi:short-subunit dehydrogenase